MTPTAQGVLVAAATATADQFDPLLANNTARVTTTVSPSADLALTMAANPNPAIVGSNVTYSITVTNLTPADGAIENGETVTVTLFLRNAGNVSSASVSATLLATNGVTPVGNNTQSYGVLTNSAAPVGRPFSLTASGANGGTISAVLQFQTTNGPVSFTFTLPTIFTFANTNFINIRDTNSAVPYPSTITVSGLSGTVGKVTATLLNLGHTYPQDIDALLAGPTGQNTILMSGAGAPPVQGANVTFDDGAAGPIPDGNGQIFTGSYQPASYLPSQDLAEP